jgi:hypothetical protein
MTILMLLGKWYVLCSSPLPVNTSLARIGAVIARFVGRV